MADRTITIEVGARISGYVSAMKTAAQATQDAASKASDWTTKHRDGLNELSSGLLRTGLAVTALGILAVSRFADFDQAMSAVGAATMESAHNMGLLRQAALEAGADTQYSATEAAGAIEALAKAGVQTTDILRGGLTGALNLAASAQMDVGQAAEIAATTMNQFGLKGKDASHIADLLAASAGKAMGDVTDMAGALKFVGPVAKQMGISLEQTAGTIAYLAQQGVLGEQAGTSLRGMLSSLTAPSQVAAKEMKALGINVYDVATGAFVGFNGIAQQMQDRMKGLTAAERDEAFGRIFGNEQITTARLLYLGGAKAIDEWTASVNDSGYAAEQARIKTDNLKGDIERLGGSLDTALIQSGSGANNVLRELAQGAEAVVDKIGEIPAPVLSATTLLAGAGGLAVLGVGGMLKLATGINDAKVALEGLNVNMRTARLAAGALGGVLAIGTLAFAAWANAQAEAKARTDAFAGTLDEFGHRTDATLKHINDALSQDRNGWLENLFGKDPRSLIDTAEKYGIAVEELQGFILGTGDAVDTVNSKIEAYNAQFSDMDHRSAVESSNVFLGALRSEASALTDAEKAAGQKALADEEAGVATDENTTAVEKYAAAQDAGTQTTQSYTDALKELIDAQREAAGVVLSERDAQRQLEAAYQGVTDALQQQVDDLAAQYVAQGMGKDAAQARAEAEVAVANKLDITTEAGRRNQEALDDVASSGWDLIDAMRANGATQGELQSTMETTRARFIAVAGQMGLTEEQANALADELNLIPANVNVQVAADTAQAEQAVDRLWVKLDRLNGRTVTTNVRTNEVTVSTGVGNMQAHAGGGFITGPGTGTSDSIAAYLSNGEYVIKASSVARYGRAFFDGLNAQRFATGGMVALRPATASSFGQSAGYGGPAQVTFRVDSINARDENAAAERLMTKARDTVAAYGLASLGVPS